MKIGVRAHDFGRQKAADLARSIKEAGFDCVQLALTKGIEGINDFGDITPKHLEDVQSAFDANNLEITVLGCYIEPSLSDKTARLENVTIFQNCLRYAKTIGAGIVGTETTGLPTDASKEQREAAYALLKDSVLRMAEVAEKEGVTVGIEPVAEHTLNTPEIARRLLDEVNSNYVKIIFDPLNLVLSSTINHQKDIYKSAIDLLGEKVVAMHIKDAVIEAGQKVWRNIGEGEVAHDIIFNWLCRKKPQMRLLREEVHMDSYARDIESMKKLFI